MTKLQGHIRMTISKYPKSVIPAGFPLGRENHRQNLEHGLCDQVTRRPVLYLQQNKTVTNNKRRRGAYVLLPTLSSLSVRELLDIVGGLACHLTVLQTNADQCRPVQTN